MEEEKETEAIKDPPRKSKDKKAKIIILLIISLIFSFLVAGIVGFILFGDRILDNNEEKTPNNVSNAHRFTGEILFSQIVGDYSFVTEFISDVHNTGNVIVNFLYKNEFVSNITVAENINIEKCSDFSIIFKDYNNDGTTDFAHIFSLGDKESVYRIYTLTKEGNLIRLDENDYKFKSNKFSLMLEEKDGKYSYSGTKVYYDGYEIGMDTGTYRLNGEKVETYSKANGESKISFADNRKIEKSNFGKITSLDESFFTRHSLLKEYDQIEGIYIDLDNDGVTEKIICFYDSKLNRTRIIMFDGDDELAVNFVNEKDKKYKLDEIIELLDINGDGVTEIITKLPDSNEVTVSKYYLGYYFPEIEY